MHRTIAFLALLCGCSSSTDSNYGDARAGDPLPGGDSAHSGCDPTSTEPICATNLAGVTISWGGTLELCNYWNDGADLSIEQERKVHLTVPAQPRAGLGESELAHATADNLRVRYGPMAAEQWLASASSAVDSYELTGAADNSSLSAVIIHDLSAAGTLHEAYYVARQPGNSDPVDVDAGAVSFTYFKPGDTRPEDAIHLRACVGDASWVELAQVLTGADQVSGDQVTVLRTLRSRAPGTPSAGSHPVHFTGARITLSQRPWQSELASSFWSHTYAAAHHNWDEHSLIALDRNLTQYHTYFGPNGLMAGEVVREVELFGIDSFSGPQFIGVTYFDIGTSNERTVSYDVSEGWRWVGKETLFVLHLDGVCDDGEVFAVGDYDYQFHLATCPRAAAPGFDLIALVPLMFGHDMAQAGDTFTGAAITEVTVDSNPGFRTQVNGSEVDILGFSDTYLRLTVRDATPAVVQDSLTAATLLRLDWHDDELMRFENADGVYVELVRRWAGQGVGESSVFAPVHFLLSFGGQSHFVEAWDKLDYSNTHHNWNDGLTATDDTLRAFWRVAYESGPLAFYVRAETLAGVEVLAETAVTMLP